MRARGLVAAMIAFTLIAAMGATAGASTGGKSTTTTHPKNKTTTTTHPKKKPAK